MPGCLRFLRMTNKAIRQTTAITTSKLLGLSCAAAHESTGQLSVVTVSNSPFNSSSMFPALCVSYVKAFNVFVKFVVLDSVGG